MEYLENLKKLQENLAPSSHAYKTTDQAITTESLRMATFSSRKRSVLARSARFAFMAFIIIMMLLALLVNILEYTLSDDKPYALSGLVGASLIVVLYIVFVGVVFAKIDQYENEREFYKQLVKIPVVMKSSEVTRARKYVCRQTRNEKRRRQNKNWAKQQDQKWARMRAKVKKQRR